MNRIAKIVIFTLILFVFNGCSSEVGRFTILTTKSAQINQLDLKNIPLNRDVEASDGRFWFLFIPFGGSPSMEVAVDECLSEGKGDLILNAKVYDNGWTALLFSWGSFSVTGDVADSLGKSQ